jgi:membrane-bound metal-dependent hydrolase YbcI (DUF457 family)
MPLPIAHGLLGATLVAAVHPCIDKWKPLFLGVMLANFPDLDILILWGLNLRGIHRSFSHSLVIAIAVTLVIYFFVGRKQFKVTLAYGLAFLSHTVLDFFAAKAGGGVMLWWPFSNQRYKFGMWGFSELSSGIPVSELLYYSLLEGILFTPLLFGVLLLRGFWLSNKLDRFG